MTVPTRPATAVEGPYKGLEHFEETDARFFFGRDGEIELVIANLLAARLTLLYGESGVGKSSLLRAGVVPRLREEDQYAVVVFSSWRDDPAAGLARALCAECALDGGAEESLAETLASCVERSERDVLVVLDQFEEYFVYHPDDDGPGSFAAELPRALRRDDLGVSFLISIREDALARLDRFKGRIPNLFDTYLRVDPLDREAGRAAIVCPLEEYDRIVPDERRVEIEPELVEAVLDEVQSGRVLLERSGAGVADGAGAAGDRIETPYLQLVLRRLWEEEQSGGSRTLRLATLRRLGGAERIVRTHLDATLGGLSHADQDATARVLRYLVTPSGTKIAHAAADLAAYAELPSTEVERVLGRLVAGETRILRPVGDSTYEIYHDVLAPAILDWRARHVAARERRRRRRIAVGVATPVVLAAVAVPLWLWVAAANHAQNVQSAAQAQALELARAVKYYKQILVGHTAPVNGVAFSPDGSQVVTASDDGTARIWDVGSGRALRVLDAPGKLVGVAFSGPRGSFVATAGSDGKARIWDTKTGNRLSVFGGRDALDGITFAPFAGVVMTAGDDETARIWKVLPSKQFAVLGGANGGYNGVTRSARFDPTARFVVTASDDGRARVWNVKTARVVAVLPVAGQDGVADAEFSPDGRLVVTAGGDGRTIVWNWRARRELATLPGHRYWLSGASFSPDGKEVVTAGGADSAVARIWAWRLGTGTVDLEGHTGTIRAAVFSPDGTLVATASDDETARVWAPPRPAPDLVVEGVNSKVSSSGYVSLTVHVANIGQIATPATMVGARAAGLDRSAKVPPLRPGASGVVVVPFRVPVSLVGKKLNAVVRVDSQDALAESNESNNAIVVSFTAAG